jgi:acid phosphatase family membrane protein YuiD
MKQFEMDCYEVTEADGGGMHSNHVAFVSTLALATELVNKSKGWRTSHPYKKVITIFDTMEEIEANSKANLRKSGLAKLTAAEREALGV